MFSAPWFPLTKLFDEGSPLHQFDRVNCHVSMFERCCSGLCCSERVDVFVFPCTGRDTNCVLLAPDLSS